MWIVKAFGKISEKSVNWWGVRWRWLTRIGAMMRKKFHRYAL